MSHTKKNLAISFLTQYLELVIQFAGVLVLARLLSPEEIGTYSVAAFLMALLHVFRDFGVARYIVQEVELTADKIRAAFGVAILLAWLVSIILFAASSHVANLYDEPSIRNVLVVMSASFFISPLGSWLIALQRREMMFMRIFAVRISSATAHVVTAISLGYLDFGALSLAWANFAGILAFGIVAFILRPAGTPISPTFRNVREILSFGSISSLGSLGTTVSNNVPDVVLGKIIDLAAAGYYSRANGLTQLFKTLVSGAVMPLILPYFAQIRRENGDPSAPYRLAVEYLTAFAWPFFGAMALLAFPIVRTLYGDQWDVSVPLMQVLCGAGAVAALSAFAGDVVIANGYVKELTKAQLLASGIRIAFVAYTARFGLIAVGIGIVIAECISLAVISCVLHTTLRVTFMNVLRGTGRSAGVALFSVIGPSILILVWSDGPRSFALEMLIGLTTAAIGWIAGIFVFKHPLRSHLSHLLQRFQRRT